MRHGSLFSGIGGFDLAAQWMGWENVFQVEWDGYCQKVLAKNFPNVKRYGDIREFDGTKYKGAVDIVSGGFPCQPFSHAGKRKGKADDRYLWPSMLRIIKEVEPSFVVGENVAGLISMDNGKTLDAILADLEAIGYKVESFVIPACAVGAWHRRDRIWVVAYNDKFRQNSSERKHEINASERGEYALNDVKQIFSNSDLCSDRNNTEQNREKNSVQEPDREAVHPREFTGTNAGTSLHSNNTEQQGKCFGKTWKRESNRSNSRDYGRTIWASGILESPICRKDDGVTRKLDEARLFALGNAIVPQVAYEIFKAIQTTTT